MPPSATDVNEHEMHNGTLINDLAELLERKERKVAMALYAASEAERIAQNTPGTKEYDAISEDRAERMLKRHPWAILQGARFYLALEIRKHPATWQQLLAHTDAFAILRLAQLAQNQLEG